MVCYYRPSCIDLPVALVYCQVEGCPSRLHNVCQGEYVVLNYIDFDRSERNICHNFVDELQGQGKSEMLKKVINITIHRSEESEEYKE